MALLHSKPKSNKIAISLRFEESLLKEIKAYQDWAAIDKLNDFFEQSARFVLEKDKNWIRRDSKISLNKKVSIHLGGEI